MKPVRIAPLEPTGAVVTTLRDLLVEAVADLLEVRDLAGREPAEALLEELGLPARVVPGRRARVGHQLPERRLVHPRRGAW